jgi:hypothetical protein
MYPKDILNCLNVGKTYYKNIYDIKKVEWDFEKSVINYTIHDITYISNIIQYTIISYILKNNNISEIDTISENLMNNEKSELIISKYIHHMIDKKIIIKNDKDHYVINNNNKKLIDISSYTPNIKDIKILDKKTSIVIKNEFTPEAISYLRQCLLVKMFKTNSTTQIMFSSIKNKLLEISNNYLNISCSNLILPEVKDVIKNLSTVNDSTLMKELLLLESKDVIEKTKTGAYVYIV